MVYGRNSGVAATAGAGMSVVTRFKERSYVMAIAGT